MAKNLTFFPGIFKRFFEFITSGNDLMNWNPIYPSVTNNFLTSVQANPLVFPSANNDHLALPFDNTQFRKRPNQSRLDDLLTYDKSRDTVILSSIHTGSPVQTRDGWRAFFTTVFFTTSTIQTFGNARTLGIFFKQWKEYVLVVLSEHEMSIFSSVHATL